MDQQYPEPGRKSLTGQEGPEADTADMTSPAPDGKGVGAKAGAQRGAATLPAGEVLVEQARSAAVQEKSVRARTLSDAMAKAETRTPTIAGTGKQIRTYTLSDEEDTEVIIQGQPRAQYVTRTGVTTRAQAR